MQGSGYCKSEVGGGSGGGGRRRRRLRRGQSRWEGFWAAGEGLVLTRVVLAREFVPLFLLIFCSYVLFYNKKVENRREREERKRRQLQATLLRNYSIKARSSGTAAGGGCPVKGSPHFCLSDDKHRVCRLTGIFQ